MPHKIIIVRHGETEYNSKRIIQGHLDIPLNERGIEQAKQAAHILKTEKIDAFFTSDLKRALKTAEISAQHHDKPLHITKLLREKYFGKLQGMTFEQIGEYVSKFGEQGNFSLNGREEEFGIETEDEVYKRIDEFRKILDSHEDKTVAVFSHGGFIRRLLIAFGVPATDVETMQIPNATPMALVKKGDAYVLEK